MINIALVNQSTVVKDADASAMTDALQTQVSRDFFPVWGVDAKLTFLSHGKNPAAGSWVIAILDNADQANALGYHDITPDGLPLGKVFAKTTIDDGGEVSVTTSHELLEMLGDHNVLVSDFVYPAYFESFRKPNSTQFDHGNKITAPFSLLAGGYISVLDLNNLSEGWQQLLANREDRMSQVRSRARIGSRRERRRINRAHWIVSRYQQKAATA